VTHDQVTAILREHMITFGIICVPSLVTSKANDRVADAKQFRYDATYSFDFINADKPEEKLTIVMEAHSMDNADKAPGKALSYAKKYAVLKLFEIETGEDEESRYQQTEIDLDGFLVMLKTAETMDSLSESFKLAIAAAKNEPDAMKRIIKVKDDRKKELSK